MDRRAVVTAAFIGAGILVVGGFVLLRSPAVPDRSAAGEGYGGIVASLCRARDNARTDSGDSRRIFLDEVHAPLHELADEIATTDRAAAAELLQAKQAVEADLEEEPIFTRDLKRDLEELIDATIAASTALGEEVGTCG